ncbi:MAG: ATP synthase F0 subunit B [Polyangiaceae bacterium]
MPYLTFAPSGAALGGLSPQLLSGAVNVDLDPTFVMQIILFTAFTVLMKDLIFDPMLRVFEARERMSAGAIAEAREKDEEAIALKQDYDDKLDGVRRKAAVDREQIRAEVKALETELMADARTAMQGRLQEGLGKLEGEVATIRADLEAQRAAIAAEIATQVLGRAVEQKEARS